jgi:F-type H+-transporting ATPase subunit b
MNLLSMIFITAEGEPYRDDNGQIVTHHWLWPEQAELIYGTVSSLVIFWLLWKFAGPPIRKGFTGRTARIQEELDAAAKATAEAEAEAASIRQAKGDIDAERQRMFADAKAQAESLLADGRTRLETEVAELEARAEADIAMASARAGDELRAEIARISSEATDRIVSSGLDDAVHQELVEAFIAKVGQS